MIVRALLLSATQRCDMVDGKTIQEPVIILIVRGVMKSAVVACLPTTCANSIVHGLCVCTQSRKEKMLLSSKSMWIPQEPFVWRSHA